jgi:DNA-directed RNA polymerase subunit RPC12/RpoP
MIRCEGSGEVTDLVWAPDKDGNYPGGAVCPWCSSGILVLKRSAKLMKDEKGEFWAGKMRIHTREAS